MKNLYEIDKDSLLELSKKLYEEGCLGYMDLKDSICEKLVEEFLEDKKFKKSSEATNLNLLTWDVSSNLDDVGVSDTILFGPSSSTPQTMVDLGPELTLQTSSDTDVVLRNTDQDMLWKSAVSYFFRSNYQ
jgi:hypothetical protein